MVDVSIEVMHECLIQEVRLDGQEIYVQPLTMSENLTKLAHKIDFSKDESEEKGKATSEGVIKETEEDEEDEKSSSVPLQPSLWPWDSVRNKLKAAFVEMCVLQDVLTIAKGRHYLHVDSISTEITEPRGNILIIARKRALNAASNILLNGCERLRKSQDLIAKRSIPDFHYELLRLRNDWRLKKVGKAILGDLSYKSAGSRYWQSGTFEVSKSDDDSKEVIDTTGNAPISQRSPIRVTIPSELEGVALIQVVIRDMTTNSSTIESISLDNVDLGPSKKLTGLVPNNAHWQKKLEAAHNVIFCKEIFAQLAREAVQVRSQVPHMVIGNQIISHLFPGIHLSISLIHNTEKTKQVMGPEGLTKPAHNHVLEHSIHQLLREMHFRNNSQPIPHPVTATLGVSKRRRLAGPFGFTRTQLQELSHSESMLEQIIQQSRHLVVWQKVQQLVDEMSKEILDPQIIMHNSNLNSATESTMRISISFSNYETIKTTFALHINVDTLTITCKDGRIVTLSYEAQELRDFILCQVSEHHFMCVHTVAKQLGWKVMSTSNHLGVGDLEEIGNAQGIMIVSSNNDRVLSVRSQPVGGVRVYVKRCPNEMDVGHLTTAVQKPKWTGMNELFQEISLERVDGSNFAQKIETVMACLMPEKSE